MDTVLDAVRDILGQPEFYARLGSQQNYSWDYGLMLEYMIAGVALLITISWVFKLVSKLFG